MAGGTFTAQNKIRPGAYINFKTNKKPIPKIGTRGVVVMDLPLTWGDETDFITITHRDFEKNGRGLFAKTGLSATGEESLPIRLALQNANKVLLFRNDRLEIFGDGEGLARAYGESWSYEELARGKIIGEAKYAGTLGNQIHVQIGRPYPIISGTDPQAMEVVTIYTDEDGKETILDIQRINDLKSGIKPLRDNDFVTFTFAEDFDWDDVSGAFITISLEGGKNGEIHLPPSKELLCKYEWNVFVGELDIIKDLRENEGKKVQNVITREFSVEGNSNYEGTIWITQGIITKDGTEISKENFAAYIAGMTAGAEINQSNTYHVIEEAVDILEEEVDPHLVWEHSYTMEEALQNGVMMLSRRQDGAIVIEKDINSLHTFEDDNQYKDYSFTKNRVIRTLDEINNSTRLLFEKNYIGKVDNTEEGRNIFKGDLINYLKLLQSMNCIQNFDAGADIEILAGNEIDELVVNLSIQPVDAMEKLYMTVTVG